MEQEIATLMDDMALSKSRNGGHRAFSDLLEGRFHITKLHRIELAPNDANDISGKVFDFSKDTIEYLIEQGIKGAKKLELD